MKMAIKRRWLILTVMAMSMLTFAFCTGNNVQAMDNPDQPYTETVNGKVLVAYFSRANHVPDGTDGVTGATNKAGNTQTVADYISHKTGGDLFEIVPERDYPVSHSECSAIAQQEARDNARPALITHVENMDGYNVVFIGFPIWVYREPMAVLTFLEEYDFNGKMVIPFCTSMAVDIDQSMEDFKNTLPGVDVKDGLRLGYTLSGDWQAQVDGWLDGLNINIAASQENYNVTMTFSGHTLTATLEDNATTRAFVERLPLTLPMMDLYGREMCYRFPDALPIGNARTQGYEVGEIVYYPPMHSFVILYAQNGEHFQMQKLGRVDSGVEQFEGIGDVDVKFELQTSSTAITQVRGCSASVRSAGGKILIEGEGILRATAYDADGITIGRAINEGHAEIDCKGYNGVALVNVLDGHNHAAKIKILIKD